MLLRLVLGGCLGLTLGVAVWIVALRLSDRYIHLSNSLQAMDNGGQGRERSARLTLIEALTVCGMVATGVTVAWRHRDLAHAASAAVVTSLLVCISIVDFRVRRIPNVLVLGLLLWSPVQVVWLGEPAWSGAGLGLLVGGGIFLVLAIIQRGAMGAGDVKLMAAMGAILGYPLILYAFIAGALVGGLAAVVLLITRRAKRRDFMAYGPYLAFGGWLVFTRAVGLWPF